MGWVHAVCNWWTWKGILVTPILIYTWDLSQILLTVHPSIIFAQSIWHVYSPHEHKHQVLRLFMQIDHACSFSHIKMFHLVAYDSDCITQADPLAARKMKLTGSKAFPWEGIQNIYSRFRGLYIKTGDNFSIILSLNSVHITQPSWCNLEINYFD